MTTYSPRVDWPRPDRERQADWQGHNRWCRHQFVPQSPARLGSSLPPNSYKRGPYGVLGLSSKGRREIWRSLKLLEELRGELFFWTITLPTEALHGIGSGRGWAAFQDRIRHELVRLLEDRLGRALVVGVAEIQEKRLRNSGTYAPHLHVAFVGRRRGWNRWAFDHADLDGIIERAATACGAPPFKAKAAGNVAPVRASVCAYMAKYMTKGCQAGQSAADKIELRPKQWWFRSSAMLRWVADHVFPLSLSFIAWVHENRGALEDRELIRHQQIQGLPETAPLCWRVDWRGPQQLAELIALWHEWQQDAEWRSIHRLLHDRDHPRHHPIFH